MIVLHHCHQSRSMRVLWCLHELGVPFELRVYPFDKTLRSEEFLARSPAGRVLLTPCQIPRISSGN